ncbi:MAG: M23 family metallopeptidase [Deltaproteobacteria bacterium]|nr:M23 family metallopeptidase [Deltaproteobacteria bacterium]
MKRAGAVLGLCLFTLSLLAAGALPAQAGGPALRLNPAVLAPGQPALVTWGSKSGGRPPHLAFQGRSWPMWPIKGGFQGVVACDLGAKTGRTPLVLRSGQKTLASLLVTVAPRDYGVRKITVDPKFLKLSPAQLRRHKAEMVRQKAVYQSLTGRMWQGFFLQPVPGPVTGAFGRESVINGEPRSPHGGVDLKAPEGQPVVAAAAGRVALAEDTFFGGNTVLIDHGQGLISGYRHLEKIEVKPGQRVTKGQIIGLVGMTGRVTGPHLHYDVHLNRARIDPLAWQGLTRRLAPIQER